MTTMLPVCLALVLVGLLAPVEAADRAAAHVTCTPAGAALTYDCTIDLANAATGVPLTGVGLTVGADMPSMPMAHNVRPTRAVPAAEPGVYRVRLELEMHGEWVLRLRLSGPIRDQIFVHLNFTGTEVIPAGPNAPKPEHRH